jgi:hypothetical protein
MTTAELLETVRRVEVRTNRLVNDTMVGAYLSQFRGRGMDFEELRESYVVKPVCCGSKPIEFDEFGNCGEFATIRNQPVAVFPGLIPSNSTGLEFSRLDLCFNSLEFEGVRSQQQ